MPNFDKFMPGKSHSRYEEDTSKSPLENAKERFAQAKIDVETRLTPGAQAELKAAREHYLEMQTNELMSSMSFAGVDDIAAETYIAYQSFEDATKTAYDTMLDSRNRLTKLDAKVGKWLSGGNRVSSWVKKAGVSSGFGFVTGAALGFTGSALAAGFPITTAVTGVFAGMKAGVRKQAFIEENGDLDRGSASTSDEHLDWLRDYNVRIGGTADDEQLVKQALRQLSGESLDDTNNRQKRLRIQVGAVAASTVVGGVVGYGLGEVMERTPLGDLLGATKAYASSYIDNLTDDSGDVDVAPDSPTEAATVEPAPTEDISTPTATEYTDAASTEVADDPTFGPPAPEGTPDATPVVETPPATEQPPIGPPDPTETPTPDVDDPAAGEGGDGSGSDGQSGNESLDDEAPEADDGSETGDQGEEPGKSQEDTTEKPVDEPSDNEGDSGADVEADPDAMIEALTAEITINHGDGVTQALNTVLESAGYPNVPPDQLFGIYEGLINDPNVGPDGIFNGATLEWNEPTNEWWITGEAPFEANFTPEAAEWINENVIPDLEADDIDGSAQQDVDMVSGSDYDSGDAGSGNIAQEDVDLVSGSDYAVGNAAQQDVDLVSGSDYDSGDAGSGVIEQAPEGVETTTVTANPGDGMVDVFNTIATSEGYEPTTDQLVTLTNAAVEELGADGVFVDTVLEYDEVNGWYELPESGDLQLTPEAEAWMHDTALPGLEDVEADVDTEAGDQTIEPSDGDAGTESGSDSQGFGEIERIDSSINSVNQLDNFTIDEGEPLMDVLDHLYTELGYDFSDAQLLEIEEQFVNGVEADDVFDADVPVVWDNASEQYVIGGTGSVETNFSSAANNWLQWQVESGFSSFTAQP